VLQADCKQTQSQVGIKVGAGCSFATAGSDSGGMPTGFLGLAVTGLLGVTRRRRAR